MQDRNSKEVVARSLGVMFEPPTLTLVYSVDGKLRKRTMPVRKLHADSDPVKIAQALAAAHPSLLAPHIVSSAQLERLVGNLVQHRRKQLHEEDERERERQREQHPPQFADSEGAITMPPPPSCAAAPVASPAHVGSSSSVTATSRPLQSLSKPAIAPLPSLQPIPSGGSESSGSVGTSLSPSKPAPPSTALPPKPPPTTTTVPKPTVAHVDEAEELEEIEDFDDDFEEDPSPASSPARRGDVRASGLPSGAAALPSRQPPSSLSSGLPPPRPAAFAAPSTSARSPASGLGADSLPAEPLEPNSPHSSLKSTLRAFEEDLSSSGGDEAHTMPANPKSSTPAADTQRPIQSRGGRGAAASAAAADSDGDDDDVDALLDDILDDDDAPVPTKPLNTRIPRLDAAANGHRSVPPLGGASAAAVGSAVRGVDRSDSTSAPRPSASAAGSQVSAVLEELGADGGDLQSVSEEALQKAKDAMEATFEANRLKPGDAGYVHDKRVEPPAELEDNDWDDEIEDFETDDEEDPLRAALLGL